MLYKKMFLLIILTIIIQNSQCEDDKNITNFENVFENKASDLIVGVVRSLEGFNDRFVGASEWGQIIGYKKLKPVVNLETDRGFKKMSMAMMPLIFHVGATSTWMLLTTIMAAKSVAIGLLLLVFKIAVSSAKIASFFTLLKTKATGHHHDVWAPHGDDRRLNLEIQSHNWNSYGQEWTPSDHSTGVLLVDRVIQEDIKLYQVMKKTNIL